MDYVKMNTGGNFVFLVDRRLSNKDEFCFSAFCHSTNMCEENIVVNTATLRKAAEGKGVYDVSYKGRRVFIFNDNDGYVGFLIKTSESRFISTSVDQQELMKLIVELKKK